MKWTICGPGRAVFFLTAVFALFFMIAGAAHALRGPLELPSPERDHPENALLTNITRAGDRLVAVGEHGVIIYSNDQGRHWHQAEVPVSSTLTAVTFPTPKSGWAVGFYGLVLHSTDGGKTWQKSLTSERVNEIKLTQAKRALQAAKEGDVDKRKLMKLKRDVSRAERAIKRGTTAPFLDIWFANEQLGYAIGGYGLSVRTTDGGQTWHSFSGDIRNDFGWHFNDMDAVGEKLYVAAERGHLYRSGDQGRTWTELEAPYQGTFFGVIGSNDGQSVFVYGLEGALYQSSDNGQSWQELDIPLSTRFMGAATLANGSLVVLGASGAIACRPQGAAEFNVIREKGPPLTAAIPVADGSMLVLTGLNGVSRLKISEGC